MARATFRLTDERRQLVEQFVRFRYLRMSHIYALYGALTTRGARRLVRAFWAHGYLLRRVTPGSSSQPQPASEFAYWLSPRGVALAEDTGIAACALPQPRPGISRTLAHELTITDFHMAADGATASRGLWLYWEQYRLRRGVNPDALFAITDPARPDAENTSYTFLEIERSQQGGYAGGRSVLLRRLAQYAKYQGSADCRKDWEWFDEFGVVIVVTSEIRQKNLLATLERELPLPMFRVMVEGSDLSSPVLKSPDDVNRTYSVTD